MRQEMVGFGDAVASAVQTICKQSALRCRQITTPAPHHSIFTIRMLFLMPNQHCQGEVVKMKSRKPETRMLDVVEYLPVLL